MYIHIYMYLLQKFTDVHRQIILIFSTISLQIQCENVVTLAAYGFALLSSVPEELSA